MKTERLRALGVLKESLLTVLSTIETLNKRIRVIPMASITDMIKMHRLNPLRYLIVASGRASNQLHSNVESGHRRAQRQVVTFMLLLKCENALRVRCVKACTQDESRKYPL